MSINQNVIARKLHWNNFNLSHEYATTGRFGNLIPVDVMEVVPGDLFSVRAEYNMRLSPLSAPAMVRLNLHLHSFYVPYRIITPRNGSESTWERFIMSVGKPLEECDDLPYFYSSQPLNPSALADNYLQKGSLWDYLGLPVSSGELFHLPKAGRISALPHLAMLKCWNDWYRRDQIEDEITWPLSLGGIDLANYNNLEYVMPETPTNGLPFTAIDFVRNLLKLRSRNYERDYFTSGLPEPQYGDDVTIGGDNFPIYAAQNASMSFTDFHVGNLNLHNIYGTNESFVSNVQLPSGDDPMNLTRYSLPLLNFDSSQNLRARNGSNVGSSSWILSGDESRGGFTLEGVNGLNAGFEFSINELRLAMQIQGVREQINRGGSRYIEIMKSVYGVSVSDLRLQRAQYLGGIKQPITIGAVLQTSESANTPQGTLTGQGGAVGGNNLFRTRHIFEEHGLIITFMSVTPRTSYGGGTRRLFRKFDPLQYYCPAFDHLGEQQTMSTELFDTVNPDDDYTLEDYEQPFAYNPMYQEYKTAVSTSTGEFRDTLANWVLTRRFDERPSLSPDFIHADSDDFDNLFMFENVENTSNEHFQIQLYFDIKAKRPMSKYSTPFTFY